jgi:hypothetical protein
MKKIKLPNIIEAAKKRPLSYDPLTDSFIHYDEVCTGIKKIVPLERLNEKQLLDLVIERQLKNEPNITVVLTGETFTNERLAIEIKNQTKIGKLMYIADINYLKFYLSQFPHDCFEK